MACRPLRMSAATAAACLLSALVMPRAAAAIDFRWIWGHPLPQGNPIHGLAFPNATRGYAVGAGGVVLRSDDNAASWQVIQDGAQNDADFLDVRALDASTLDVVGEHPGVWRSTDAGGT